MQAEKILLQQVPVEKKIGADAPIFLVKFLKTFNHNGILFFDF